MDKEKKLAGGFALPKAPTRTEVQEKVATRFVQAERKKKGREGSRLRREAGGERIAVYLPPRVAEDLRVRCARERRSFSDAVTEAITMWLKA